MKNQRSLGLGLAMGLVGLACTPEARAATITRDGSPLVFVSTVTVGDETWVKVWENYRDTTDFIHVIPLPEGATEPRLVKIPEAADPTTAPRAFKVEPVTGCDASWSCSVDRGPAEPSAPTPHAVSGPIMDCFATNGRLPPPPPSPPPPPDQLRVVARDQVVPTARKLAPLFAEEHSGHWPRCGPLVFLPSYAANLPDVSRFAVVTGEDHALAFRVRGAFKWPLVAPSDGGARELIMLAVVEAPPPGGSTYFPRALLRSEPPRLYLAPGEEKGWPADGDGGLMASLLAEQLASQGKISLLERAMPLDASVRVLPNTALLSELGPSKLPPTTKPRSFKLFRYRFRNVSDIGLSPTTEAELPHPREVATGFLTVVPGAKEPRCPTLCYRPHLENGVWTASFHQSPSSTPGIHLVEAPFSLATPVMRDLSPFPPLPTPASATPAPPPAPSASASTPTPARAPVPAPAPPGPRGCTCDTVPTPRASPFAEVGALGMIVLWMARRRRAGRAPTKGTR